MRGFFWFLIILFFSVWLGLKISQDPGYALFTYGHWTIEMPLWFAMVSVLLILFVLYGVLRFFDNIGFSIYRLKNWLRWRRKYKSYNKTNRGLLELVEGRWKHAEHYLLDSVQQSDAPLINYLAAAKAAQELHAFDRRDTYLRKAHHLAPQAEIAIELTQARLQYEQGQLEQALATLRHLRGLAPKHASVLKLLEKVYVRLADWKSLLQLLPFLRKAKLITDEQMNIFERNTYQELLHEAAHKQQGLAPIRQVWQTVPRKLQADPELIDSYANILLPYQETADELESLIHKALKRRWHADLARIYGLLKTNNPQKQLSYAESWQQQFGNQPILLLTLGRLCMRCQLWGKARSYFEEGLKLEASSETYAEYGKLLEQLGETQAAIQCYQKAMKLT